MSRQRQVQAFENPPNEHRNWTRWCWFGPQASEQGIAYELGQFNKEGMGGVEIQWMTPLELEGNFDFPSECTWACGPPKQMKIAAVGPLRKRGSKSVQKELDSRFRGNDAPGVIFERVLGATGEVERPGAHIHPLALNQSSAWEVTCYAWAVPCQTWTGCTIRTARRWFARIASSVARPAFSQCTVQSEMALRGRTKS